MANADTVMARLESGLPLKDALMPGASYEGWHSHCKLFPQWAARAKALVERNALAGKQRKLEKMGVVKKRAMTHCKNGHEFNTTNTRFRPSQDGTGLFWRQCKICERERQQSTGPVLKSALQEKLVDAMKRDVPWRTLRRICPNLLGFYRTVRQVESFRQAHHKWAMGGQKRKGRAMTRSNAQRRYRQLMELLPERMDEQRKMRIIGAIYEAHGSRRYKSKPFGITKAAKCIRQFIADDYKQHPDKAYGDIKTPWSLDAPIYDDGEATLADRATGVIWDEVPV
ncbi:hypothetical protein CV770_26620 [Bradyrhizobium sp. AC87j1]|uniref:hypothetical protein n=1 Tax=Bradyrhizobium sp. AC87j1 TaxID=2055894 RepID=UPI000CEBBCF9|nr:hypothetical protein [Bradyrhizobium sp. AC87j1]PPQ16323.1 hypothetical protein CV770_26620 [Bradyrhizobium sp. AC87j1]